MVLAALAVWVGLKVPQVPTGVHVQSTPALAGSFWTVALTVAVALGAKVAGGAVVIEMLNVPALDTFTVAVIAVA